MVWLTILVIFHACTDVNVCNYTWWPYKHHKRICTDSWLSEKNPSPHRGVETVLAPIQTQRSTNWATSLTLFCGFNIYCHLCWRQLGFHPFSTKQILLLMQRPSSKRFKDCVVSLSKNVRFRLWLHMRLHEKFKFEQAVWCPKWKYFTQHHIMSHWKGTSKINICVIFTCFVPEPLII